MAINGLPQYKRSSARRGVAEWVCYDQYYTGYGDTKPLAFEQWKAQKAHQPRHMREATRAALQELSGGSQVIRASQH